MSASYFGSGYWPGTYFSIYWQSSSGGGPIIGALSGEFIGTSLFTGTLGFLGGNIGISPSDGLSRGISLIFLSEIGSISLEDYGDDYI